MLAARARPRPRVAALNIGVFLDCNSLDLNRLSVNGVEAEGTLLASDLRRGDRVATLTGNSAEHVVAFFACAKAWLALLPLNLWLSPFELSYQLDYA